MRFCTRLRGVFLLGVLFLAFSGCTAAAPHATAPADALEGAFDHPPASARPYVYWFWMGRNVTTTGITGDLEALKNAGFGGTTMCNLGDVCTPWPGEIAHSPNPDIVPYVSAAWWKLVRHAAVESERLGLDFGFHNCAGYESNGGPWITPELAMQEICFSQTPVEGGEGGASATIALPRPTVDPRAHMSFPIYNADTGRFEKPEIPGRKTYYRDIAVLALPATGVAAKEQVIDLTARMDATGKITWAPPPGKWIIYRFGHTTMGALIQPTLWKATGLEADKMSAAAISFHMDHLLGEIKKHVGDQVGRGLKYLWFDSYEAGTPSWTPLMRQEFQTRRGYDLTTFLPTFAKRVVGSADQSRKFAADFHQTISDLYRDIDFKLTAKMAHAAGLQVRSEPYGGPWNITEAAACFDQVAGEFWNRAGQYHPYAVSETVTGARAAHQNVCTAEAFTAGPGESLWNETPEFIKPLGDAAYCDGINRLMLHRFTHEPWGTRYKPGVVMGQWGTHFDRTQTWWEPGKAWVAYMQRCQALLQWGAVAAEDFATQTADATVTLRTIHRREGSTEIWFVANLARTAGNACCAFQADGRVPELWDPVRGTRRNLPDFHAADGQTTINLSFAPAQSYFIVLRKPLPAALPTSAPRPNFPATKLQTEIAGPWSVTFDPQWGGPAQASFPTLEDWTKRPEPGIRYYSGTATYHHTFNLAQVSGKNLYLDLGTVHHFARVHLNGHDLGVIWCAPWGIAIPDGVLKPGENQLDIAITNVWANRLIGDEQEPADCQWLPGHKGHGGYLKEFPDWFVNGTPRPSQGRYCFTTWNYFTKDSPLTPSGLLGPVRLLEEDPVQSLPPPVKLPPVIIHTRTSNASSAALESDVLKTGLIPIAAINEIGVLHDGGGTSPNVLINGTTHNGSGGDETLNDGHTFRGYGAGSVLTLQLDCSHTPHGYDLTGIRTFAGHVDGRASQNYRVLVALATAPAKFLPLTTVALNYQGRASEVRMTGRDHGILDNAQGTRASGVAAVRLEFQDGPQGFNVYREICLAGQPTAP